MPGPPREIAPDVDTLFEIGGQDAKFVGLQAGIPVDYSMNDGCSAGTGSFLEEAAASDMRVPIDQFGPLALSSAAPIAFGERCAAFIDSEVRSALQQGLPRADVLAGLVYSIVENYLSRVVGSRQIGRTVMLQGGVALNPAVAPAVAALAGVSVTVPPNPELMGCEGAARMAGDWFSPVPSRCGIATSVHSARFPWRLGSPSRAPRAKTGARSSASGWARRHSRSAACAPNGKWHAGRSAFVMPKAATWSPCAVS